MEMLDKDTTEIILANVGAMSLTLTDVHEGLQIASMATALIFTIIKIVKEVKKWRQ